MGKRKIPLKIWLFWHTGIRIKIPACTMSSLNFLRRDCAPLNVGALSLCTSNTKQHQAQPPWHHASKQKIQDLWLSLRVYRSSSSQNFEGSILGSFQFNALKQATVLWKGYKTGSPALPLEFFKNITFSITQSLDACGCQYWIHHGWCSSNKKGCVSCVITLHGWRTLKIPGTRERQMKWFGPDCLGLKHPWVCRWTPLYVVSFVALILQKRLLWAKSLKEISEGGEWTLLSDFLYLIKRRSSKVPPNPCHRRFKTNSSHLKKGPTTHNSWELVSMSLRLCDLHFSQHGVDGRKPWLSLRSPLMRWEINAALKCCTLGVLCCLISFHSTLPDPKIISSKSTSELHTKRVTNCIACSSESSNFRALRLLFHDIHTLPTHVHRAQKKISTKPRTRPTIWKQSSYLAAVAWQILKVKVEIKNNRSHHNFWVFFESKKTPNQNNKPALRYICLSLPPINKTTLIPFHLHTGSRTAAGMSESCGGTTDAPDCAGENAGASTNLTNDNDLITSNYIALWIHPTDLSQQLDMFKKCSSVSKPKKEP